MLNIKKGEKNDYPTSKTSTVKLDSTDIDSNRSSRTESQKSDSNKFFLNRIAGKLLTVGELSFKLGVSKKTIYGWIYRGTIKPIKVGPRLVRFNEKEVEQWISKQGDS